MRHVLAALAVAAVLAGPPAAADDLATLLAERAIIRLADGLDRAVDAKDWPAARDAFADEVTVDFSPDGSDPVDMAADDLITMWRTNLHAEKQSFHLRGNHAVRLNGDAATLVSHGYAWNRQADRPGGEMWEVWGTYHYTLARGTDGWAITGFDFRPIHDRGNRAVPLAPPRNEQ